MATCPICQKASTKKFRPFCSARCADIDLGRWMIGEYSLPSDQPLSEQEIEQVIDHAEKRRADTTQADTIQADTIQRGLKNEDSDFYH